MELEDVITSRFSIDAPMTYSPVNCELAVPVPCSRVTVWYITYESPLRMVFVTWESNLSFWGRFAKWMMSILRWLPQNDKENLGKDSARMSHHGKL